MKTEMRARITCMYMYGDTAIQYMHTLPFTDSTSCIIIESLCYSNMYH